MTYCDDSTRNIVSTTISIITSIFLLLLHKSPDDIPLKACLLD